MERMFFDSGPRPVWIAFTVAAIARHRVCPINHAETRSRLRGCEFDRADHRCCPPPERRRLAGVGRREERSEAALQVFRPAVEILIWMSWVSTSSRP